MFGADDAATLLLTTTRRPLSVGIGTASVLCCLAQRRLDDLVVQVANGAIKLDRKSVV